MGGKEDDKHRHSFTEKYDLLRGRNGEGREEMGDKKRKKKRSTNTQLLS